VKEIVRKRERACVFVSEKDSKLKRKGREKRVYVSFDLRKRVS
jgi:hypothetical protein